MDRFKRRNLITIFFLSLIAIIEIYLLINLRIREFFFIFFVVTGISIILYRPQEGVYYILSYLLFMPFLRRFILIYEEYAPIEPLYLVPDILIIFFFSYFFISKIENFKRVLTIPEFSLLFVLQVIMFLEIFNPLQGSLLAGFGGAKFLLVPSLFAYIGFMTENENFNKLKKFVLISGFLSFFYAVLQRKLKYFEFEKIWLINIKEEYTSLFEILSGSVRPFSFFSSVAEFGQFMCLSALISLFFIRKNIKYLFFFIFIYGIIISGMRSAIYSLLITSIFLIIFIKTKTQKEFFKYGFLIFTLWIILVNILNFSNINTRTYTGRFLQGIFDPLTLNSSLHSRLRTWKSILIAVFTHNFFGGGLGVATRASVRFGGFVSIGDSTFLGMFSACGVLGGLLLIYFVISIIFKSIKVLPQKREKILLPLCLFLSISIGQFLTYYLVGAIFWLSVGLWVKNFYNYKVLFKN